VLLRCDVRKNTLQAEAGLRRCPSRESAKQRIKVYFEAHREYFNQDTSHILTRCTTPIRTPRPNPGAFLALKGWPRCWRIHTCFPSVSRKSRSHFA
jgi:hypothetical protein